MPEYQLKSDKIWLVQLLNDAGLVQSNGEGRRMIKQGAVSLNGERISDMDFELVPEDGMVIKVGKRRFCKLVLM